MEKLNYWLVYRTLKCKWRVFADPIGALLLFPTMELATETGHKLVEQKLATTFTVLDVRMSYHQGTVPLTQEFLATSQPSLPESESWGVHVD